MCVDYVVCFPMEFGIAEFENLEIGNVQSEHVPHDNFQVKNPQALLSDPKPDQKPKQATQDKGGKK